MDTLIGVVGNYVTGERFWGRENEINYLLELISEGASVSIIAQRRIGKTSLMHEAGKRLSPDDHIVLHIDVQSAHSAADLVGKLALASCENNTLTGSVTRIFSNILSAARDHVESVSLPHLKIQLRDGLSSENWQEKGSQMLAALAEQNKKVVLFFDELPILLCNMLDKSTGGGKNEVHELLCWLRSMAMEFQGRISMVFAGSIGLEPVLNRVNLSADINHLTPFTLEPWPDHTALSCLQALAAYRKLELPEEAALRILTLLGCNIPYHVQLFFSKIRVHCKSTGNNCCSPEEVDEIFNTKMLGTQGQEDLSHMQERLKKNLRTEEYLLAMDLLNQTAVTGFIDLPQMQTLCARHGFPKQEQQQVLAELFRIFQHDGYLKQNSAGRFVFVSHLLHQWWRGAHAVFFEPV